MQLYALHDFNNYLKNKYGAFPVDAEKARRLNADGFGIFHAANSFDDRRTVCNLTSIDWWFVELDDGSKEEQLAKLTALELRPSWVIESKRGYHAYWRPRETTVEQWKRIVRWGLVPSLGSDPKATDVSRILRAPGYLHQKDRTEPFLVRTVWRNPAVYSEEQMLEAFPSQEPARPVRRDVGDCQGFWPRVSNLDGRDGIERLSGHWSVRGELFRLDEQHNGNANIIRLDPGGERHDTGCFIDSDGRLGNVSEGPTLAAWINWYWQDGYKTAAKALKELYPELDNEE